MGKGGWGVPMLRQWGDKWPPMASLSCPLTVRLAARCRMACVNRVGHRLTETSGRRGHPAVLVAGVRPYRTALQIPLREGLVLPAPAHHDPPVDDRGTDREDVAELVLVLRTPRHVQPMPGPFVPQWIPTEDVTAEVGADKERASADDDNVEIQDRRIGRDSAGRHA